MNIIANMLDIPPIKQIITHRGASFLYVPANGQAPEHMYRRPAPFGSSNAIFSLSEPNTARLGRYLGGATHISNAKPLPFDDAVRIGEEAALVVKTKPFSG